MRNVFGRDGTWHQRREDKTLYRLHLYRFYGFPEDHSLDLEVDTRRTSLEYRSPLPTWLRSSEELNEPSFSFEDKGTKHHES